MTHVLVTRPLEASRQLAEQLAAAGLTAIVMPFYTFSGRQPAKEVISAWAASDRRKMAVFTSPRAVRFGLEHLPAARPDELEFAVIGSATRAELESRGYPVHLQAGAGFTSEDLLKTPELALDPGEAVIFCAPGGRESLQKGLLEMGWKVVKAMVYERLPLRPDATQIDALSGADRLVSVWTSVSALDLARSNLPAALWSKILQAPALVISARIQHHLEQCGAAHVELADGPGNPEILDAVLRITGKQHLA